MPSLDPAELARGRELLEAATPAPWRYTTTAQEGGGHVIRKGPHGSPIMSDIRKDGPDLPDFLLVEWLRNNAAALLEAAEERDRLREKQDEVLGTIQSYIGAAVHPTHPLTEGIRKIGNERDALRSGVASLKKRYEPQFGRPGSTQSTVAMRFQLLKAENESLRRVSEAVPDELLDKAQYGSKLHTGEPMTELEAAFLEEEVVPWLRSRLGTTAHDAAHGGKA